MSDEPLEPEHLLAEKGAVRRQENGRLLPGSVLNPNGRPRTITFAEHCRKILREVDPDGLDACTNEVSVARMFIDWVKREENVPEATWREFLKRVWPEVQRHEHTGADGGPLEVASAGAAEFARILDRLAPEDEGGPGGEPDRGGDGSAREVLAVRGSNGSASAAGEVALLGDGDGPGVREDSEPE